MSEAAHVPFTETKAPESAERLHRGALGLVDISASTMANIGPAYSFYFGFAGIVIAAGLGSPLVILVAAVAIALLGNTLSQFSRAHPSTGGFITFVGKTFGGTSAVTTALVAGVGYIIAISSVLVISGGFLSIMIQYYTGTNIPWIIFSAIFTAGAMFMMFRGVAVSTKLAGFFFAFELTVLLVVSIAVLIKNGGHLSSRAVPAQQGPQRLQRPGPRLPAGHLPVHRLGELGGAGRGDQQPAAQRAPGRVPVDRPHGRHCTCWWPTPRSPASTTTPRRSRPPLIPFIAVAHSVAAWLAFIAYLAGLTSTLGVLIAAVNSQCRLIFNAGREGLLPRWLGYVHPVRRTPVNAIIAFVGIASAITLGWALGHWIGGHGNSLSALNFFFESSTMGTILILFVYLAANVALPFYYRKYRPAEFNIIKHVVLPALGVVAIGIPIYYLFKPGQPPAVRLVPVGRRWASSWCPSSTRSGWSGATPAWATGSARSSPTNNPPARWRIRVRHRAPFRSTGRSAMTDTAVRPGQTARPAARASAGPGHRGRVPGRPGDHGRGRAAGRSSRSGSPTTAWRNRPRTTCSTASRPTAGCARSWSTPPPASRPTWWSR